MTAPDLDAIRTRADAATDVSGDGTWETRLGYDVERDAVAYEVHAGPRGADIYLASTVAEEVSEFIAHARTDVPALLALVDAQAARIDKALALHQRWPIYDECGHRHEEGEEGVKLIEEVGYVCEDGFLYAICRECCCDDVYQTEQCVSDHILPCWPCPTVRALTEDVTP